MGKIVYRVKVELITKFNVEVFRVFEIYRNTSLRDFHKMMKWSFYWEEEDEYQFRDREDQIIPKDKEEKIPLGDILKNSGESIRYIYNLEDHCEHRITLEEIRELSKDEEFQFQLLEIKGRSLGYVPYGYHNQKTFEEDGYPDEERYIDEDFLLYENEDVKIQENFQENRFRIRKGEMNLGNLTLFTEEELLQILKKEGSYPDFDLVSEILKRPGSMELMVSEVKKLTAGSDEEILEEKTYIKNLFYLLSQLECSEIFPMVKKISYREMEFVEDFYPFPEIFLDFIFSRVGRNNIKELMEIGLNKEYYDVRNDAIFALWEIHGKSGEADPDLKNFLENIYPATLDEDEKKPWEMKVYQRRRVENIYQLYDKLEELNDSEDAEYDLFF